MKLIFKQLAVIIIFSLLSFNVMAASQFSPEMENRLNELKNTVEEFEIEECRRIVELYDLELLKFFNFLEGHFENKSSTSSLANIAIARYSEFKNVLNGIFAKLAPKTTLEESSIKEYETAYASYSQCIEITETYTALAKEQMMKHITNNSVQKKTTMLLEKLNSINNRLRELNMAIAEMYSFFATFKNKLPGFLSDCVTSP